MSIHKRPELDLVNPPGQIVNDITLGDYIARKTKHDALNQVNQERKLTFDEWYTQSGWAATHEYVCSLDDADSCEYIMRAAWNAAQENK